MKTLITFLTTTMLVAGATNAMAFDRQASDEAAGNALAWQSRSFDGAYASARQPVGEVRNSTFSTPAMIDFQGQGSR